MARKYIVLATRVTQPHHVTVMPSGTTEVNVFTANAAWMPLTSDAVAYAMDSDKACEVRNSAQANRLNRDYTFHLVGVA